VAEQRTFKVLILASDTADASRLIRAISDELERGQVRDSISLEIETAARIGDITQILLSRLAQSPGILHLCAVADEDKLLFHTSEPPVSGTAFANAIRATSDLLSAAALSNCFTDAISAHVNESVAYVVGTAPTVDEETTEQFFRGFYRGLAFGKTMSEAFALGVVQVQLKSGDTSGCLERPARMERSLVHERSAAVARHLVSQAATSSAITNIRPRNISFVGRESLFHRIQQALGAQPTFVTQMVSGMSGVGKTELAVEFSYRAIDSYDVIWWIGAEEPDTIAWQLDRLATVLNIRGPDIEDRVAAVRRWLETQGRWLLIVDNVEDWDAVRPNLPRMGAGHVIVTTRRRDIDPMTILVDVFTSEEADDFVHTRIRNPTAGARKLVEAVGRLPLALEQACSFILSSGCSVSEYAELFQKRATALLAAGGTGGHDGTVMTTFSLALQQAERLCGEDELCADPIGLATLLSFLGADDVPISLLSHLGDGSSE
jgi:hypothetical protein